MRSPQSEEQLWRLNQQEPLSIIRIYLLWHWDDWLRIIDGQWNRMWSLRQEEVQKFPNSLFCWHLLFWLGKPLIIICQPLLRTHAHVEWRFFCRLRRRGNYPPNPLLLYQLQRSWYRHVHLEVSACLIINIVLF